MFLTGADTKKEWFNSIKEIPVLGSIFVFLFIFIPPVLTSFIASALIPGLHGDIGFTKSMFVLLPLWNLLMWILKIRLFILFIPAWILLGAIAIVKAVTHDY